VKCFVKLIIEQKEIDKNERKMNTERLTTCIKHLAVSGLSSSTARIKSSCNLIGNRFEMPNVSYTQPLWAMLRQTLTADIEKYKINLTAKIRILTT
jgi:hypothetical protein